MPIAIRYVSSSFTVLASLLLIAAMQGCGPGDTPTSTPTNTSKPSVSTSQPSPSQSPSPAASTLPVTSALDSDLPDLPVSELKPIDQERSHEHDDEIPENRTLANILNRESTADDDLVQPVYYKPLEVDETQLLAESTGIRKLQGKHLTLYTDLESTPETDALPGAFDQVTIQWCEYFGFDPDAIESWHMTGFLMRDRERFRRLGLIPHRVEGFRAGYSLGSDLWLVEQPCDWRNLQLLLHEGTHGFMNCNMGSCGPPWYMEGVAELLSTCHVDEDGHVTLNYMPQNREEAPYWGRIMLVREAYADFRARQLEDVLRSDPHDITETEDYAWCWALAYLLDRHPRYRDRFHAMNQYVRSRTFTDRFIEAMGDDWQRLNEEWQVLIADLDFNYDIEATVLDATPGTRTVGSEPLKFEVAADQGWQNSGIRVEAGKTYEIAAIGRYQVGDQPQPWISEPDGVTIRYHHGMPYGMLLGAVRNDELPSDAMTELATPIAIGRAARLTPESDGTLFFRVNDSPGELDDNSGTLTVGVRPAS